MHHQLIEDPVLLGLAQLLDGRQSSEFPIAKELKRGTGGGPHQGVSRRVGRLIQGFELWSVHRPIVRGGKPGYGSI